jgi:hypothetical protein
LLPRPSRTPRSCESIASTATSSAAIYERDRILFVGTILWSTAFFTVVGLAPLSATASDRLTSADAIKTYLQVLYYSDRLASWPNAEKHQAFEINQRSALAALQRRLQVVH